MRTTRIPAAVLGGIGLLGLGAGHLGAQGTPGCPPGQTSCAEVTSFSATVTDFRQSVAGNNRMVSATVRFRNRTSQPLILAYVAGSGLVIDDQGMRYVVGAGAVRGIGQVANNSFDPKFVLQPGEASDARFEFVWQPLRGQIYGTTFEIDMAVREVEALVNDQYRLGREHALHFARFGPGGVIAEGAAPAAAEPAPAQTPPAEAPAPEPDPCEGRLRCWSEGAIVAEVTGWTGGPVGRHHVITATIRIRNTSTEPVVLGYRASSSVAIDDAGNRYYWGRAGTHDGSAKGIGIVVPQRSADPQFALRPGQSRNATFSLAFFNGINARKGTQYSWDLVLDQLEPLPGNQIRTLREYSVGFRDVTMGSGSSFAKLFQDVQKAVRRPPR